VWNDGFAFLERSRPGGIPNDAAHAWRTGVFENIYNNERIGSQLVNDGLVTQEQLQEGLRIHGEQGGFLGKILVEKEFLYEEALLSYFLERYALPYVQPDVFPINPESKKFISEDLASKYLLLPVDHIGIRLSVVCPGPLEGALLGNALDACQGCPVTYFLSTISEIETALSALFNGPE